ncbi:MAG: patatin-like phospholipase family protein [Limnochordales bacterium]|nr:patatin-like phospholipase family protein [Limnochordales bacterium]
MEGRALRADAVFEGGGVRGIAFAGAVSAFEEAGYEWHFLAGTSAGAIVAALLAAGYKAAELRQLLDETDFRRLATRTGVERVPLLGPLTSLCSHFGIHSAANLESWLADLLAARGVKTFGDLAVPSQAVQAGLRHRLQVVASDVTNRRMLLLPRDAESLGFDPDRLSVALAVRMSISIPLFYKPVRIWVSGKEVLVVDGGLLSNFPVWIFDEPGRPRWPAFGFRLIDPPPARKLGRGPLALYRYMVALVETSMEGRAKHDLAQRDWVRTVDIPTHGIRATNFGLDKDQKLVLYNSGRQAALAFLKNWDFQRYVELYGPGGAASAKAPAS